MQSFEDRRQFKRVHAPVYCRPLGFRLFEGQRKTVDISLGGMRIYSDDEVKQGTRLELELFLPDATTVLCKVEVVWIEKLPPGAPSRFDVGLKFTDIAAQDVARLGAVLEDAEPA